MLAALYPKVAAWGPQSDPDWLHGATLEGARHESGPYKTLAMLGMAVTGVVGCGIQEGLLLADPAAPQHDAMRFACHYALENVLPSVTWSTKPAHLVAAAHSLPMDVLSPAAAGDASAAVGEGVLAGDRHDRSPRARSHHRRGNHRWWGTSNLRLKRV